MCTVIFLKKLGSYKHWHPKALGSFDTQCIFQVKRIMDLEFKDAIPTALFRHFLNTACLAIQGNILPIEIEEKWSVKPF